jgi:hypothetical protein
MPGLTAHYLRHLSRHGQQNPYHDEGCDYDYEQEEHGLAMYHPTMNIINARLILF